MNGRIGIGFVTWNLIFYEIHSVLERFTLGAVALRHERLAKQGLTQHFFCRSILPYFTAYVILSTESTKKRFPLMLATEMASNYESDRDS